MPAAGCQVSFVRDASDGTPLAATPELAVRASVAEEAEVDDAEDPQREHAAGGAAASPAAPVTPLGDATNRSPDVFEAEAWGEFLRKASPVGDSPHSHGMPNRTAKYSENVPVQFHTTPFEDRVVRCVRSAPRVSRPA